MRARLSLMGLSAACLFAASSPLAADVELTFGVYAADKPSTVVRQFRPVLNAIQKRTAAILGEPVKIRMKVASSYEQGVANIATGRVDFTRLGPASYVEAKSSAPGITILAMEAKKGKKVFQGVICVHRSSAIHEVRQLRGKSFAFGDERSTIGRYLSQQYLVRNGIHAKDLTRYEYLGRHDKVGSSVGLRLFDAGALKEGTFKKLVAGGQPIRSIATFPNVTKPWVARSGAPERVTAALSEAILALDDPTALAALGKDGFVTGSDADFAVIRKSVLENSRFFE